MLKNASTSSIKTAIDDDPRAYIAAKKLVEMVDDREELARRLERYFTRREMASDSVDWAEVVDFVREKFSGKPSDMELTKESSRKDAAFEEDESFKMVLKGFDAEVIDLNDPSKIRVVLYAKGAKVFDSPMPVPQEMHDKVIEEVVDYAARAAIDLYESEHNILGQGAGALEVKKAMSNPSCDFLESCNYESWYFQFKGTPYEQEATVLLEELINLRAAHAAKTELAGLVADKERLLSELDKFNMEMLKESKPPVQIMIIQAFSERKACETFDWVDGFIEKFKGHRLEPQVLMKIHALIETQEAIDLSLLRMQEEREVEEGVKKKMNALLVDKAKNEVRSKLPESGIEVAPEMANDIADLMEGVSFDEPLEPMMLEPSMSGLPMPAAEQPKAPVVPFGNPLSIDNMRASSRKYAEKEEDNSPFSVEDWGVELGKVHEGTDPAEVPAEDRIPFQKGEQVKLKKAIDVPGYDILDNTLPKGSIGWVNSEYDGHGDFLNVRFEGGTVLSVPCDMLAKG